jgi:hypothetical protein
MPIAQSIKNFLSNKRTKAKLKAFRQSPIRFITTRLTSLKYDIKCWFFPYNVIKIKYLPRSWCDRDQIMFHGIFQVLVDFVETEQPFCAWDKKWKGKHKERHTDRKEMREYIERWFNTDEARAERYYEGISDKEKSAMDENTKHHYQMSMEILYIYEWYKDEKFDVDKFDLYEKTGEKLVFRNSTIERIPNGKPKLITWDELHEIEQDHKTMCNAMLRRVLNVREYLWT